MYGDAPSVTADLFLILYYLGSLDFNGADKILILIHKKNGGVLCCCNMPRLRERR